MQSGIVSGVRSNWYDRSLTFVEYAFNSIFSPHALTQRKTYTVPANRVAIITLLPTSITRYVAATASGLFKIHYRLTKSGGSFVNMGMIYHLNNTIYNSKQFEGGTQFRMTAGDEIELYTNDVSTGGSVSYVGGWIVNEYDA